MAYEFRFLEDIAIADTAFEARGSSPSELFLAATQAVFEVLADSSTVSSVWQKSFVLQEDTIENLLFDWLSALVFYKDADGVVFSSVTAIVSVIPEMGRWQVEGMLRGAPIDPSQQTLGTDIKAVTKHCYTVEEQEGTWIACVVLDT